MVTGFVEFYLFCQWKDFPPVYRLYFDDELMTERTYIWDNKDHVLQERIPVLIDPTVPHNILVEQIGQHTGTFQVHNIITTPPNVPIKIDII